MYDPVQIMEEYERNLVPQEEEDVNNEIKWYKEHGRLKVVCPC